jgi:hypothetical protein
VVVGFVSGRKDPAVDVFAEDPPVAQAARATTETDLQVRFCVQ